MKKPFNIKYRPQIESGEYKVETRCGHAVTDIHLTKYRDENVVVYYVGRDMWICGEEGNVNIDKTECEYDLFIVTPEEELTEFETALMEFVNVREPKNPMTPEGAKNNGSILLNIAREQIIKDGYVIEKKTFHDAVEKVSPEVMKEVSDKVDMEEALRLEYENGKSDALKDLPRWKKIGRGNNYLSETKFTINGRYLEMNDILNDVYEVPLSAIEKLPGFKE